MKNVFQTPDEPRKKYATIYIVVRDIVRSFWGTDMPDGIDDLQRVLLSGQYIERVDHQDSIEHDVQAVPSQSGIAENVDFGVGTSQALASVPRSVSSTYDDCSRPASVPTSPRYRCASRNKA